MSEQQQRPSLRPTVVDRATSGHFTAAAEGRLAILTCQDCGRHLQLPRPRCIDCGSVDLHWDDVPATGTVHSWTVVEHQVHPDFPAPYTILLVDVDTPDTVRLVGSLPGRPEVSVGTPVAAAFRDMGVDDDGNTVVLPVWELSEDAS